MESVANYLTAVGKLLILTVASSVWAADIEDPKFFNYSSGSFVNQLATVYFGWFKTLDHDEKLAYNQAITHAVLYSNNGETVRWYKDYAFGSATPSVTWPSGSGYCRRVYIQVTAYGVEKNFKATACLNEADNRWTWYN